jgi:hypothetical protein
MRGIRDAGYGTKKKAAGSDPGGLVIGVLAVDQ